MRFVPLACVIFLTASVASAQTIGNAAIRGRVTDPTGAALPGVTVTATSPALLVPQLVTQTDTDGSYRFAELPIGEYKILYELSGFQRLIREEIHLAAGFTAEVNLNASEIGFVSRLSD